jgi:hypothetical protein
VRGSATYACFLLAEPPELIFPQLNHLAEEGMEEDEEGCTLCHCEFTRGYLTEWCVMTSAPWIRFHCNEARMLFVRYETNYTCPTRALLNTNISPRIA